MKAERRHELHQNDLAQWLGKVADWSKKHANHITAVVLGVAVVFLAWVMISKHIKSREEAVYANYQKALTSGSTEERTQLLEEVAGQDRNEFLAASACLDLANEYTSKAVVAAGKGETAQAKEWSEKASKFYTQLTQKHAKLKSLAAQGHYGLGQLAMNAGNFDEAGKQFKQAQDAAAEGYPIHYQAKSALTELEQIRKAPTKFAASQPSTPFVVPSATQPSANPLLPTLLPTTSGPAQLPVGKVPASAPAGK